MELYFIIIFSVLGGISMNMFILKILLKHVSTYPVIYYNMYFPTVKYSIQQLICQIVEPIVATS